MAALLLLGLPACLPGIGGSDSELNNVMALLFLRATPNPTCVTCDVRMDVTFVGRSYRMHTTLVGYYYIILLASSGMYAFTSRII